MRKDRRVHRRCYVASSPEHAHLQRTAFAIVRTLGLTREERQELAGMLPGRDGPCSWADLSTDELAQIVLWLQGAQLIRDLMRMRA